MSAGLRAQEKPTRKIDLTKLPRMHEAEDAAADEPKTLVESAYRRLRADIIDGTHAPGAKLRVEHLKDRYEVSAGTLREALTLLVSDSLVVAQGQRGFRVAPMSLGDFEDITNTRILLEGEALRAAIEAGDDAWESRVAAAFHLLTRAEEKLDKKSAPAGVAEEWERRNREFHEALISACPSNWVRHFVAILYRQSERYRRLALFKRTIPRDLHAEHTAILEATFDRDADRAVELLGDHVRITLKAIQHLPPTPERKRHD